MKESYSLQQQDFDRLLGLFSQDREEAGKMYEKLRDGLVRFFQFRGCHDPDELADETFNRVASKLPAYDAAKNVKPAAYIYGFARNILLEYSRSPKNRESQLEPFHTSGLAAGETDVDSKELAHACLRKCLGEIPDVESRLMVEYYSRERQEKIELRRRIAERLGCTIEVLHTRIFRMKSGLRTCVQNCREKSL